MAVTANTPLWVGQVADYRHESPVAGDGLLHPLALIAIATLILNDHVLKAAWPGLMTGKLSDFAGLLFFPLLAQALIEVVASLGRSRVNPSQRVLIFAILTTGATFASIKAVPIANATVATVLGLAQWAVGKAIGSAAAGPVDVQITADPTDLIALPILLASYAIGIRRCRPAAH